MSDPAPQQEAPPAGSRPRRRFWRYLLWGIAALVAAGMIFYQPLGTWAMERLAVGIARQANVGLRLKVGGNLFSRLTIEDLHGEAIGETPVKALFVEHAEFHYSIPRMLRRGVADFLSSYELRNATVEIDELPESASEDARTQAQRLTDLLRDILQQPALFSNRVELENVNVRLNFADGPILIDSVHILLDPTEQGFIRVGRIRLPRLPDWHQIEAEATYNGRRLVLDGLELGEKMEVVHAELIPSRVTGSEDVLTAKLALFGGEVNVDLRSKGKHASLELDARDIPITEVSRDFSLEPKLEGRLESLTVSMKGEAENPSSWVGGLALRGSGLAVDEFRVGAVDLTAALENGTFRMHDSRIVSGKNELKLAGEQAFPGSFTELLKQGLALRYRLHAPEMKAWHPALPEGSLDAEGEAMAGREKITFSTKARLTDWRLLEGEEERLTLSAAEVKGDVVLALSERGEGAPWFAGLTSDLAFQTTSGEGSLTLADQGIQIDRVALELKQSGAEVTLRSLALERKENRVGLEGRAKLPVALEPLKAWEELEFDAALAIHAPSLEDFNATGAAQELKGKLEGEAKFHRAGGKTKGEGTLTASELGWREFQVRSVKLKLPLEETRLPEATLGIEINDTDRIDVTASADLAAPYAYQFAVVGKISDLGVFTPFAGRPLGGALSVDWRGNGRFDTAEHHGEGAITLADGLVDLHHPLTADISARYSPTEIVIGQLKASAPEGSIAASARWADQRLTISDVTLQAGKHGSATGHLSMPLDLRSPKDIEKLLPESGALEGAFVVRQIDLAKVIPPAPPPKPEPKKRGRKKTATPAPTGAEGVVDATLAMGGTMGSPEVTLEVKGRKLRSRAAAKLAAADLDAAVTLKEKLLKLKGEVRTPSVQPLRFQGELPLDLREVATKGALDPATPVSASVVLPQTSAAVLKNFSPAIRYIDGTLRLDATVKGTVGKPIFSGGAHFDLPAVRMADTSIPGINRFRGDLLFSGDKLTVQRFGGDVAGGPFELSGDVGLKDWSAPQLNLRLKSTGTLLVRNDTLTVRTDTNLKIAGPLPSAEVKGKVTLRKSRFYRDVEILPLGLPGKPVPVPVENTTEVSIDVAPVRDWKFDIAVKTKEPFLIRSNMARGAATVDLRVGGTGLSPTLDGTVRLENLVALLPFSRLTIEQGFIRFNPADSFNPTLDIHGSSPVRGTMVHAHIYGTASEPETVFTSEPPLPQEEIIALLATGATTQGLAQNNEVMAGRAGSLLLQDLYRKMTRKRPKKGKMETAGDDLLGDRFSLDVGTVDARTGRQEVGGRFRLNNEFELGGGMDIEGDVRVQLRYLLRFR